MNNKFLLCIALLSLPLNAVFIPQTLIKPTIYGKTPQQKRLLNRAKHAAKRKPSHYKLAQQIAALKRYNQAAEKFLAKAELIRQESAPKTAHQERYYGANDFGFFN